MAGAIVLGKTVTTNSLLHPGKTKIRVTSRTRPALIERPARLSAAGMVPGLALGSQTRVGDSPGFLLRVVGYKPTFGMIREPV